MRFYSNKNVVIVLSFSFTTDGDDDANDYEPWRIICSTISSAIHATANDFDGCRSIQQYDDTTTTTCRTITVSRAADSAAGAAARASRWPRKTWGTELKKTSRRVADDSTGEATNITSDSVLPAVHPFGLPALRLNPVSWIQNASYRIQKDSSNPVEPKISE